MSNFTNSPLVNYTRISPNRTRNRKHAIMRITPHHVVGQCSVESLGSQFAPTSRQACSNYGIGPDGRVGMYCEEKDMSWCSSSEDNDNRAVTIECADSPVPPYKVNDAAYKSLIELCTDICIRNGKTKLLWIEDKNKALSYKLANNEMLLTVHRWFDATACPGDWLYQRMGEIATKVNENISKKVNTAMNATQTIKLNGINVKRYTDYLVLYTGKSTTGTNEWGAEVQLDANGIAISNPVKYVGNMVIPVNGYVLSGHGKYVDWIMKNIKKGTKVNINLEATIKIG